MRPYTFLFVNNMLQIQSLYLPVSNAPSYIGERGPKSQSASFPCMLLYFIPYVYTSIVLYSFTRFYHMYIILQPVFFIQHVGFFI